MQLRCKAPHPFGRGDCDSIQAGTPGGFAAEFRGFVDRVPDQEDEFLYLLCQRKNCHAVSVYKLEDNGEKSGTAVNS